MAVAPASTSKACVFRSGLFSAAIGLAGLGAVCSTAVAQQRMSAGAPEDGVLGFVVRHWYTAIHETPFMDECPEGLNIGNDEIWWRGLPREERGPATDNGLREQLRRWAPAVHRGPNGENVCLNPEVVTDPPLLTVEGEVSYGVNLDGTLDGSATPRSCEHQKFRGVNGQPGVSNQMYRLLGCTYGWRTGGVFEVNADEMRGTSGLSMILIEVTGVEDVRNDDDVTVNFYRSVDQFAFDAAGKPTPFASYRIDVDVDGTPRYAASLKGRIEEGVLRTDAGDATLPFYGNYAFSQHIFRDMSLELTIAEDGATADGLIYGYYDVDEFLYHVTGSTAIISTADFSCSALVKAAWELADGYPDAQTGQCTSLSSAFKINTTAAFIIRPEGVSASGD